MTRAPPRFPWLLALGSPAEFAAAARAGNDISGVRLLHQIHLDRKDPIVTDQPEGFLSEIGIFLKSHGHILRGIS